MGQIFELIADNALKKLDSYYNECHVCNKADIDLYDYQGKLLLENGEIDNDIYAVCTDCILTKKLRLKYEKQQHRDNKQQIGNPK